MPLIAPEAPTVSLQEQAEEGLKLRQTFVSGQKARRFGLVTPALGSTSVINEVGEMLTFSESGFKFLETSRAL